VPKVGKYTDRTRNMIALGDQMSRRNAGPQIHSKKATRKDRQEARQQGLAVVRGKVDPDEVD